MPRKSMTGDTHSPVIRFRVDTETQAILDKIKSSDGNISEFIRNQIKTDPFLRKPLNFENINLLKETAGIYAITNHKTGKIYIGQTIHLKTRLRTHLTNLNSKRHTNIHLQEDFTNNGVESFEFSILEKIDTSTENLEKILNDREQEWLGLINLEDQYNSELRGEKNKLTNEQKTQILALYGKESGHKVARDFDVSHTAIYKIWKKKDRNQKETQDTTILKALFPYFAIQGIKTQEGDLTPDMMARLIEISKEPSIKVKIGELRRLNSNVL